jgi:hypothetical protein
MRLHEVVESYIKYKRSLGMRFRSQAAVVYDWFTEGFETPVLKEAKALLDESQ